MGYAPRGLNADMGHNVKNPDFTVGASPPPIGGAFGSKWTLPRLSLSLRTRLALWLVVKDTQSGHFYLASTGAGSGFLFCCRYVILAL